MNQSEKEKVLEVFSSVRPYLTSPSEIKEAVEEISESSSDLEEFENSFQELTLEVEDPTKRADHRIFINKLTSR